MQTQLFIDFEYFSNEDLPENKKMIAIIRGGIYEGIVVVGEDFSDCFLELSKTMKVMELNRKQKTKESIKPKK